MSEQNFNEFQDNAPENEVATNAPENEDAAVLRRPPSQFLPFVPHSAAQDASGFLLSGTRNSLVSHL